MWNNWHWFLGTYIIKDGRFLFKKDFHCNWTIFINASNSSGRWFVSHLKQSKEKNVNPSEIKFSSICFFNDQNRTTTSFYYQTVLKLDRVGLVDNRHSTDYKNVTKDTRQVTCDTWHVTRDTLHIGYGKHYVKNLGPQLTSRTPERGIFYVKCIFKAEATRRKRRFIGLKEFRWTKVIQFVIHMITLLMWNNWHWLLWTYTIKDDRFLFKKDFYCNWTSFINASNSSDWVTRTFSQAIIESTIYQRFGDCLFLR